MSHAIYGFITCKATGTDIGVMMSRSARERLDRDGRSVRCPGCEGFCGAAFREGASIGGKLYAFLDGDRGGRWALSFSYTAR